MSIRASFKAKSVLPLVCSGLRGYASMALAQSPNTFTATGNMTTPRALHSATLLPNGKVLITRGILSLATEPYDPAARTFTATGATTTAAGIATLLGNGKVFMTGDTAELYDPAKGTFAPMGAYVGALQLCRGLYEKAR